MAGYCVASAVSGLRSFFLAHGTIGRLHVFFGGESDPPPPPKERKRATSAVCPLAFLQSNSKNEGTD